MRIYVSGLAERHGGVEALAALLRVPQSAVSRAAAGTFSTGILVALGCRFDPGAGRYVQDREPDLFGADIAAKDAEIGRLNGLLRDQRKLVASLKGVISKQRKA